ncbi:MAG TPA: hypothetical protein VEQ65_13045 [Opitutus sp.]|nr:hypothetical protein [Opitutus sp.]
MENATRRNRKTRRQGLTRSPAGKEHAQRSAASTQRVQRSGKPVGSTAPNARKESTETGRKSKRKAAGKRGAAAAKTTKAVLPQAVARRSVRERG